MSKARFRVCMDWKKLCCLMEEKCNDVQNYVKVEKHTQIIELANRNRKYHRLNEKNFKLRTGPVKV